MGTGTPPAGRALIPLLVAFVVCAAMYSLVAPLWEAPDESEHFFYVVHLVTRHTLPRTLGSVQPSGNNEANQPPLYYLLSAPLAAGLDLGDAARIRLNPRMGWPRDPARVATVAHLLDEGWPYHGAFLAAHRIRLLSAFLGAVTIALTACIARAVTGDAAVALAAAAFMACLPGFIFASATIDNDALVNPLCAMLLLLTVRARAPTTTGSALAFGTVAGVAALTKLDSAAAIGLGALVLVGRAARGERPRQALALVLPLLPALAFLLWRLATGQHNLIGDRATWPPPRPGSSGPLDWSLPPTVALNLGQSFIGVFGRQNVFLPAWLYLGYAAAIFVGLLAGLGVASPLPRPVRALLGSWVLLTLATIFGRYAFLTGPTTGYDHGRFLYPALPAIVTLVAAGWSALRCSCPLLRHARLPALALAAVVALAIPWLVIRPAYPPPYPVTNRVPPAAAVAEARFLDSVSLAGVRLPSAVGAGQGATVTFYWRVQRPLPAGTWLFVHVQDDGGRTAAALDGTPMWGTFPLAYWRPGDVVIDQELLTAHADAPTGTYSVRVGWYDPKTGSRIPLVGGGTEAAAGSLRVIAPAP